MSSKDVVDYADAMVQEVVKSMAKAGILNPDDQLAVLKKQAAVYSMASNIIEVMIKQKTKKTMH